MVSILTKEESARIGAQAQEYVNRKGEVIYTCSDYSTGLQIRRDKGEERDNYFLYLDGEEFRFPADLFRSISKYPQSNSINETILRHNPNIIYTLNRNRIPLKSIPLIFARAYISEMEIRNLKTENCSPTLKLILENQ